FSGAGGHVVAYATSTAPGWIVAIDRSSSSVFASAREALLLEIASIAVAALIALGLIFWMLRRANRNATAEHELTVLATELNKQLADAATPAEVVDGLARTLAASFPRALAIVALRRPDGPGLDVAGHAGPAAASFDRTDPSLV